MTRWLGEDAETWWGRPIVRKVAEAAPRHRAVLTGVVRWVAAGGPHGVHTNGVTAVAYDASLDDGTGEILVRWTGRRRVAGVDPGAALVVEGTVADVGGKLVILNPRYRFDPEGSSASSTSW